jgi:predicted transcriptional regulator
LIQKEEKEYVELAVDLNDIYESSNKIDRLIRETLRSSLNQEKLIKQLIEIEIELDHIHWHYKSLKKELKQLLNT